MKHFYSFLIMGFVMAWQITYASETEPNNTSAKANFLALNSTDSGKINPAGDVDWWKITTTADGRLNITLSNSSGKSILVYLYDSNSTTLLKSGSANNTFVLSNDGLAAGTYYVKVKCVSATDTARYTISNSLDLPAQANDAEPDNSKSNALTFTLNSTKTGHVGYYYNNRRDTADWYKITTKNDGRLDISLTPVNGANTGVYLYDNDGSTLLNSKDSTVAFTLSTDGLATGTYYVKVKCSTSSKFTPYILINKLVALTQANDLEPNNTKAQAATLTLNSTNTGHVGYYYNNKRDTADWYQVTTNKDGKLNLSLTPVNGSNTAIHLYDNNGTTLLSTKDSNVAFTLTKDGLAAGTYFVKINCADNSKFTAYTLTNNLVAVTQANDAEPDNTKAKALTLAVNATLSGHVGYYYNNNRDTSDWYKITTKIDSKLNLKLSLTNGQAVTVSLYAGNGISLIDSSNSSSSFSLVTNGLEDDVYYIKINAKNTGGFAPYTLTDSVFKPTTDTLILPLNYRIKDALKPSGDVDWYKVTTNADGKLNFTVTPLAGKYTWLYLYDHDHTTLLNSGYSSGAFTVSSDGLAAGTYYVKINAYYATDTTSYLLADTLTVNSHANDKEPNNNKAQALILNLNSSKTGNVGYFYNNRRDTADWYKLTTNADGKLNITLTPVNGSYTYVYLYDHDGTTLINSGYSSSVFTVGTDGLAAGTYYIKINCYYSGGFTPYIITNSLVTPAQANDTEPNNNQAQALTLKVKSAVTGHVGYYYNNQRDTADWYKITTKADGLLNLSLTPANGSYTWVYLYDHDGTTLLNSSYSSGTFTFGTNGLAAGTYYLKVNCYYNSDFTPYTLADTLVTPSQANDIEPNNTRAQALALNVNSSTTGHIGYFYNNKRDTADWYKVTTTKDGLLKLALTPANGSYTYINLYDNDGVTLLSSNYSSDAFVQNTDGLAAGTYYVKVNCYYSGNFTPYTLTDSLFTYSYANDAEPNKQPYQGKLIAPNTTVTGHVNFYYKLAKDSVDWWKLNYTGKGNLQFVFNLAPKKINASIPYTWFYVYKDTLSSPVYSNYFSSPSNTINLSSLTKATYYIKIFTYYQSDFVTYSFSNSFTAPAAVMANTLESGNTIENNITSPGDNLTIYPNPAVNQFHIQVSSNLAANASFILRDANGKEVWSQSNLGKAQAGRSLDVNVQKLPAGNYYLQIIGLNGQSTVKKIIIIK